jgi:dual specificity tyrosine-phosphorylation-regulated kinase 2/3/4
MNTAKSLSPKINSIQSKSRIVLKKITSKPKLRHPNDSLASLSQNSQESSPIKTVSRFSFFSSQSCKKPVTSPVSSNLQKSPSTKRLFSIKRKPSPRENIGEHLLPLSSEGTIATFSGLLTKFELSELLDYQEIYYLGLKSDKILPVLKLHNMGFDDEKSDYKVIIGDHLAYQYEIIELLGKGAFAQVCRCWDHKSKREVAVKIIKSQKIFYEQGQNELKILSFLKNNEKKHSGLFIQTFEYFVFRCHLCIVFELLSFSLFDLLKANSFKGFSSTLVRRFAVQMLTALQRLKSSRLIHCDLKPENLLLKSPNESNIKMIDFGSSCFESEKIFTYVQSRIYRAPEVILGLNYNCAIDMWSFGCIVSELLLGTPIFFGENEVDQIYTFVEVLGMPPDQLIKASAKRYKLFGTNGFTNCFKNGRGKIRTADSRPLESLFSDIVLLDLLKRNRKLGCFEWLPERRMTPSEAINHPWLSDSLKLKSSRSSRSSRTPGISTNERSPKSKPS